MGKIEYAEGTEERETLHLGYLVGVEVEYFELDHLVDVFDFGELVFGDEKHLDGGDGDIFDILDEVVMEVEVEQVGQRNQVLNLTDLVVLEGKHLQLLLSLQQRHVAQLQSIQIQLLDVGLTLHWPPVADPDIGDLRQFGEDDIP